VPERDPEFSVKANTQPSQALLYRLSGDINPLHADPMMTAFGGFDRPILHGLCTFGFAARAALKQLCGNEPLRMKSIRARFTRHVFPGETLLIELWRLTDQQFMFTCKVLERNEVALSQGLIEVSG
jgi:3-hydroxyacyl-CoA dehydrogenase/3a,7a,12a-trihydroxy-5b-cholest-24-enoyl-CoA hydratase